MQLITISAVYQLPEAIDGWLYRILSDAKGASIRRVPANDALWTHGVLMQRLPQGEPYFIASVSAGPDHFFDSVQEAIDFIISYKEA